MSNLILPNRIISFLQYGRKREARKMNELKEIEFSKVLDLVYTAVDFDYFDDYKYLSCGYLKTPNGNHKTIIYFYGYSLMTGRVWFYDDIFIEDRKLHIHKFFFNKWEKHQCEYKKLQLGSIKKLKE